MVMVTGFSDEEKEILEKYLTKGMSVRDIEKEYKGYGRTRIKNIIDRYSVHSEETAKEVLKIRLAQKYHKEVSDDDLPKRERDSKEMWRGRPGLSIVEGNGCRLPLESVKVWK